MNLFYHEQIYRGKKILTRVKNFPIVVCGAGAIGSNLIENLVRQGFANLTVIDKDRVEGQNINTQVWIQKEIGALKANALKFKMFEIAGVEITSVPKLLDSDHKFKKFVKERCFLIIDAFDNSKSRQLVQKFCREQSIDCLHIGFSTGYGEIIWDEDYRVPDDKGRDNCNYPLARNLILLLIAVASETIIKFIDRQKKENYTITLGDFEIRKYIP